MVDWPALLPQRGMFGHINALPVQNRPGGDTLARITSSRLCGGQGQCVIELLRNEVLRVTANCPLCRTVLRWR